VNIARATLLVPLAGWVLRAPGTGRVLRVPWAPRLLSVALLVWLAHVDSVSALPASAAPFARHVSALHASTPARSPDVPPLTVSESHSEEASASAPASGGDTLVENGLGSPLCRDPGELSVAEQRSCQTADFVAAPDPTNDYAFDVNINTGISKWGNDISVTLENFAQLGWMVLVSATHGLVVMFEWCYSLNLLSDSLLREATVALHDARLTFTEPLMVIALVIASTLAVYHGLICRRVTDTIGGALAMLAMTVGGLWVISDPAGTVGAVEQWANQVGVGTLAVVASGSPSHPERTLAESMQVLFSSVVSAPWCYMEFGNVDWCESNGRLDGGLRKVGLAIADSEEEKSKCHNLCDAGASSEDQRLAASAVLLREAQTNGELFLALPANEPERNSVKNKGTLLNTLCGSGESADKCRGPTASQAEFRSEGATWSRLLGLCLIWIGALGMLLLLGFLALRLLCAALMGFFFLMLAPAAVLVPALGDGGRSAFRGWAMKLMEAVVAKLTYSFLLGVVLLMMKVLLGLTILGWWTQWLLISTFWWGAFLKRDQVFGSAPGGGPGRSRSIARRVGQALETPRALLQIRSTIKDKFERPAPEVKPKSKPKHKSRASTTVPRTPTKQAPDGGLSQPGASSASSERVDWRRGEGGNGDLAIAHSEYALIDRSGSPGGDRAVGAPSGGRRPLGQPGTDASGGRGGSKGAGSDGGKTGSAQEQVLERDNEGVGRSHGRSSGERFSEHERGNVRHSHQADSRTVVGMTGTDGSRRKSGAWVPGEGSAQKSGALEQSRQLERRRSKHYRMTDPEIGVGEMMADAAAIRHIDGKGAQGGGATTDGSPMVADSPVSTERRSRVMDDAREVAARRKRQLGWEGDR
jgi:hypothetical protein